MAKLSRMNDLWRTQLCDRVLTYIQEWVSYGHLEYCESWSKLKRSQHKSLRIKKCSSGITTPSTRSHIAIAHRFSIKRESAHSLYGNAHAGEQENCTRENWLDLIRRKISNVAPEEIQLRLTRSKTDITI